jgi:hypothetical protein
MIEGSGFIPLTNGSGSRRPKNMWIRWIRICNTVKGQPTRRMWIQSFTWRSRTMVLVGLVMFSIHTLSSLQNLMVEFLIVIYMYYVCKIYPPCTLNFHNLVPKQCEFCDTLFYIYLYRRKTKDNEPGKCLFCGAKFWKRKTLIRAVVFFYKNSIKKKKS